MTTCPKCGEPVAEFGLTNWTKYQDRHVRRPEWIKLDLGFFDNPDIHKLSGSQQLAFVGVLILCGKRGNRVPFDANYIKERCSLRIAPDLPALLAQGLITGTCCNLEADTPLKEKRGEERRGEESTDRPAPPAPKQSKPSAPKEHGTAEDRAMLERCSTALGQALSPSKANTDAVARARRHYSPEQIFAVLGSVREGSTPSGAWCNARLADGLGLAYILRPGEKGGADKILDQLARGQQPPPLRVVPPPQQQQRPMSAAERTIAAVQQITAEEAARSGR